MKLEAIAQSVLATLLVAAIGGGLVLWADLRTLQTATLPALRSELASARAESAELRKAIEAHNVALGVLEARSRREGKAHGRRYLDTE